MLSIADVVFSSTNTTQYILLLLLQYRVYSILLHRGGNEDIDTGAVFV